MNRQKIKITGAIIVRNGEKTLNASLESIKWCDEIIVVDDYSTDSTVEIAKSYGARIFKRRLKGDFSSQRNFALEKAKGNWILYIDADESVPANLRKEILNKLPKTPHKIAGYSFQRVDYFLGYRFRYGPAATSWFFRLVKKNRARWIGKQPERLGSKGEVRQLKGKVVHRRQEDITKYIKKINLYSSLEAQDRFKRGEKSSIIEIFRYPTKNFFINYVSKLGFLDGFHGFLLCYFVFIIQFFVQVKLWELCFKRKTWN